MLAQPNNHATLPELIASACALASALRLKKWFWGAITQRVEDILRALTAEAEKGPASSSATS